MPGLRASSILRQRPVFTSRVARRVFLLFVLCAFLPLLLFASITLFNVSSQLDQQSRTRLDEACKSTGMVLLQRIQHLAEDVRQALGDGSGDVFARLEHSPRSLRERLAHRFDWLAVGTADSRLIDGGKTGRRLPELSPMETAHLERSPMLLTTPRNEAGRTVVVLVFGLAADRSRFLFGEVRTGYLFFGDGLLRPNSDLMVATETGEPLYGTRELPAIAAAVARALRTDSAKGQIEAGDQDLSYLVSYRTVFTRPAYFRSFVVAYTQSRDAVLAPIASFERVFLLFGALTLLIVIAASVVQIRRSLVPIEQLAAATRKIKERDFSARLAISTNDEFADLGASFNEMARSLEGHDSTMEGLHQIGVALTAERSPGRLIQLIVENIQRLTSAELVFLHIVDEDGRLVSKYVSSDSVSLGGLSNALHFDLHSTAVSPESLSGVAIAAMSGVTIDRENVTDSGDHNPIPYRAIEELLGLRFHSVLCVPMRNHVGEIMGVLELVNARDKESGKTVKFSQSERQIAESLASQAAVALTKNRLVDEFRDMFEALTGLIATAIDEKSQYTGDHCRRVPVLTMMIAEEVCKARTGPCADLELTEEELYELKVAALLHDCGKVTTPVHIVDKATKLEKIFDRIELIDTRFEVVKRDLEFAHFRRCMGIDDSAELAAQNREFAEALSGLQRDRETLRQCNIGRESTPDEMLASVRAISARYSWTGPDGRRVPFLTEDEIENLCIDKGTLSQADREVINHHVVATINMLKQLPFPRHLARVPEIAGAHHERMDGTGYPAGMTRAQINLQGRILGIADVFEALTARDRPYKKGKTLSETLQILGTMKEDGHVDPDLFQVFVESGVYRRYAEQFLEPEQCDEVDLAAVPGYRVGGAVAAAASGPGPGGAAGR